MAGAGPVGSFFWNIAGRAELGVCAEDEESEEPPGDC